MSRKEVLILQMHKIVKDGANPENLKEFVVERKKGGVCQRTDIHNEPKLKIPFGNCWGNPCLIKIQNRISKISEKKIPLPQTSFVPDLVFKF